MLRASSEIAIETTVETLGPKPICAAKARPICRAVTISTSVSILTRVPLEAAGGFRAGSSSATRGNSLSNFFRPPAQVGDPLLKVQSRRDVFQGQSQLHH